MCHKRHAIRDTPVCPIREMCHNVGVPQDRCPKREHKERWPQGAWVERGSIVCTYITCKLRALSRAYHTFINSNLGYPGTKTCWFRSHSGVYQGTLSANPGAPSGYTRVPPEYVPGYPKDIAGYIQSTYPATPECNTREPPEYVPGYHRV